MLIAEAHVTTDRPSRYSVQLCRHFNNKGRHLRHQPRAHEVGETHVEWSETQGTVDFGWGQCTMLATSGALVLRVEAEDEDNLRRVQDVLSGHIGRFGRRDNLRVNWQSPGGSPAPEPAARRKHGWGIGLVAAGALAIALHLGFGGAALASAQWTGWAAYLALALVGVKVIAVVGIALRRRATRRGRGHETEHEWVRPT